MSQDMRRDFNGREELIAYLQEQFPQAEGGVSETRGGLKAAQQLLVKVNPAKYAQTRNSLTGAVTRLSPYLRHGVLSLAQVRDTVLQKISARSEGEKLINELAWRDYWQRLYLQLGNKIWQDLENYKTGKVRYEDTLPVDISDGTTGLVCIDSFSQELRTTGYLHNHQRMWMAAYIVHWRRIRWQAGAAWFLEHLLDGDPASNNLSWQWVASTFSHKPYYFNRENLERYTQSRYCSSCPLRGSCDFEGTYEDLGQQLFPGAEFLQEETPARDKPRPNKGRKSWHQ